MDRFFDEKVLKTLSCLSGAANAKAEYILPDSLTNAGVSINPDLPYQRITNVLTSQDGMAFYTVEPGSRYLFKWISYGNMGANASISLHESVQISESPPNVTAIPLTAGLQPGTTLEKTEWSGSNFEYQDPIGEGVVGFEFIATTSSLRFMVVSSEVNIHACLIKLPR
jgi:hypothetical protein